MIYKKVWEFYTRFRTRAGIVCVVAIGSDGVPLLTQPENQREFLKGGERRRHSFGDEL